MTAILSGSRGVLFVRIAGMSLARIDLNQCLENFGAFCGPGLRSDRKRSSASARACIVEKGLEAAIGSNDIIQNHVEQLIQEVPARRDRSSQ